MAEYIYKAFNPAEDIIGGKAKLKTFPIWTDSPTDVDTNPESTMTQMWTQSAEVSTWEGNYYYNIYNQDTASNVNAEPQFSIAFGTTQSLQLQTTLGEEYSYTYPSRAVYAQFLSILEESTISNTDNLFKSLQSASSTTYEDMQMIYIISVARSRIKDMIELDTWQLNLSGSDGIMNLKTTGSVANAASVPIITGWLSDYDTSLYKTGSIGNNIQMGIFYPQRGVFILDAIKIHKYIGSGIPGYNPSVVSGSTDYAPSASLGNFWEMLKSGAGISPSSSYFRARTTENVKSTHYFCRIKNYEFNYSTNPTWVSGSSNEILDEFYTEPRTFITTVGLYDGNSDSGQLVAVAKLSRPIPKDSESECLIKIRLDF